MRMSGGAWFAAAPRESTEDIPLCHRYWLESTKEGLPGFPGQEDSDTEKLQSNFRDGPTVPWYLVNLGLWGQNILLFSPGVHIR